MKEANLDPENPTVRTAVFGQVVQEFLKGEIGDFLIRRAESKLAALTERLKKIQPDKALEIAALQAEIRFLEGFEAWLGDAVREGLTAAAIIDGEDIDA
jgi:hypothetical protein